MKLNLKIFIPLIVFLVLAVLLGVGLTLNPREVPSVLIDKPVPEFSIEKLIADGNISNQDMQGKVWVLNVWASWCAACLDEHPLLVKLAENKSDDWTLFGLNYKDTSDDDAKAWLTRNGGNPYEVIGTDKDGRVGIDLGVYGVPETFVIDKNNQIKYKHIGPLTQQVIDEQIQPLIRQLTQ